ncbi:MAG: DMT family transporter [Gammaproteobacteria bacterium]
MLHPPNPARGALCAIGASLMMALMAAAIRIASQELPNEMLVFLRNSFGLLVLLPWLRGDRRLLATTQWRAHLLRSLAGLAAMYCFFYALAELDLAKAMLLNFSAPLYIAPIAFLWLGEPLSRPLLAAAIVGFLGVALVLRPGVGFFSSAAIWGAISGVLAALAMVSLRSMAHSEPTRRTVFYFSLIGAVVSSLPALYRWQTPSLRGLMLMLFAGFCATQGQLLLTHGYNLAPAARIGPYTYATVLFASLLGWWLWREVPDAMTFAGASLIILSGVLAIQRGRFPTGTEEGIVPGMRWSKRR